ncbi:Delta(1)-pyrroline-2-carboxylate reductase [Seminavis robusta]|uniref:Delta(1)-pyrroline-2-carboxylate reductase n=1 Tax=Seminavis robusta TaxID=568900 RepID=A0A9N8HQB8_9STRA|nr:Delta(1)-pyrroline-2-carboxylate reductase [Seminavis robusta]|eukprot:Sro969_g226210.1 Delta(1)-pyrroline-2-carboxylate reductase (378) ;mRNA; r:20954-22087
MPSSSTIIKQVASKMLILSEKDVRRCLSMKDCLEINRKALMAVSTNNPVATTLAGGTATVPTRIGLPGPVTNQEGAEDWTLFKPAAFYASANSSNSLMGMKIVSIRSQNPANHGLPLVPATIMVLDAETGIAKAVVAGTYLTGARTAASSGLATQLVLSNNNKEVQHLVVFGAGLQAECHIDAIQTAMGAPIPKITLINRTLPRAEQLKQQIMSANPQNAVTTTEVDVVLLDDKTAIQEALSTASVIAATTNVTQPLFEDGMVLPEGCHINGIGSYTPDMQEIPVSAVDRCRILIDTPNAKMVGDLKHLAEKTNTEHPITLLGDALADPQSFSPANNGSLYDCTFYKGVGTAIQDVMTADFVVTKARELGIGTEVEM